MWLLGYNLIGGFVRTPFIALYLSAVLAKKRRQSRRFLWSE